MSDDMERPELEDMILRAPCEDHEKELFGDVHAAASYALSLESKCAALQKRVGELEAMCRNALSVSIAHDGHIDLNFALNDIRGTIEAALNKETT